jgi:hypothetical protein
MSGLLSGLALPPPHPHAKAPVVRASKVRIAAIVKIVFFIEIPPDNLCRLKISDSLKPN